MSTRWIVALYNPRLDILRERNVDPREVRDGSWLGVYDDSQAEGALVDPVWDPDAMIGAPVYERSEQLDAQHVPVPLSSAKNPLWRREMHTAADVAARLLDPHWELDYAARVLGSRELFDVRVLVALLIEYQSFTLPQTRVRVDSLAQIRASFMSTVTADYLKRMSAKYPQLGGSFS